MDRVLLDVLLATIPMLLLASVTWRLVWPRWKLIVQLLLHPIIYVILAVFIAHWSVLIAWVHQGLFGLGMHIWFSRRHGFTCMRWRTRGATSVCPRRRLPTSLGTARSAQNRSYDQSCLARMSRPGASITRNIPLTIIV